MDFFLVNVRSLMCDLFLASILEVGNDIFTVLMKDYKNNTCNSNNHFKRAPCIVPQNPTCYVSFHPFFFLFVPK